jgi:putative tricarboxylic transport membrane protein
MKRIGCMRRIFFAMLLGAATAGMAVLAQPAAAQSGWKPERAVEIVSGTAGGGAERSARLLQHLMQEKKLVTTPVALVNKVGAGNALAYNYVGQKARDGHFLLASTLSLTVGYLTGRSQLGYRDFTPICTLFDEYVVAVVRADSPIANGRDLIERLKKDPASLSIGLSSALGSATHLGLAMVLKAAGVDVRRLRIVVFDSASKAITAALGGHVDVGASSLSSAVSQIESNSVRVLGITAPQRIGGVYAQAPTWKELGADAWFSSYRGIAAPKDLSAAQTAFWENVFAEIDRDPRWQEDGEKNLVSRQFRRSSESRKYFDELDAAMKSLLAELGMLKS